MLAETAAGRYEAARPSVIIACMLAELTCQSKGLQRATYKGQ